MRGYFVSFILIILNVALLIGMLGFLPDVIFFKEAILIILIFIASFISLTRHNPVYDSLLWALTLFNSLYVFVSAERWLSVLLVLVNMAGFVFALSRFPKRRRRRQLISKRELIERELEDLRATYDLPKKGPKPFVGNVTSKKFHDRRSPYAKRIKQNNRVLFDSREEAIAEGYEEVPWK